MLTQTTVSRLRVGDRIGDATVVKLGDIHQGGITEHHRRRQRAVMVRYANGRERVRTWHADTRMRVERAES